MTYSDAINLMQIFDQTCSHEYVVIKSLPDGEPEFGSDIDILCADKTELGKLFLKNCRPYLSEGCEIRLREIPETDQTHLDILRDTKIVLRLDLHEGLGAYQRVPVKETYSQRLLNRRTWAEVNCPSGILKLAVPDDVDNLVLRYLDYHEWFEGRPDKIKHADHIADQFANNSTVAKIFYDRLLQATSKRPTQPALRYCDLNLKRQCVWAFWSVRDKLAWRINAVRRIAILAITQPSIFARKLVHRLTPSPLRSRTLHHKAQ